MLRDEAIVLSDRRQTYIAGKDTGRYWDAGAGMVHWVIGTDEQIEAGIKTALSRVKSAGVFVEGGSFLKYIKADYSVMVTSPTAKDIKSSAVRVMPRMNAMVINRTEPDDVVILEIQSRLMKRGIALKEIPIYFERDLKVIADEVRRLHDKRLAQDGN
jgi:hypothetical protein